MSIRIQARRGTEAEWQSANPILAEGELAYSTDTEQLKLGNGTDNWSNLTYIGGLPEQSGFEGLFVTTDGLDLSFASPYPSQSGENGKFLSTNGASVSWTEIDAYPDQSGQDGKFLSTDGSSVAWTAIDAYPNQSGQDGKFLSTNGSSVSWVTVDVSSASANAVVVANAYTNSEISSASTFIISSIVNSAPETLDTLNELANALGNDAEFSTTITNSIATKLSIASASATYATINYASSASANADTRALSYATSASANVNTRALGYATSASAHVNTLSQARDDLKANLASPTFTGTVTAPHITVSGNQAINAFRNRNVYIDTGTPTGGNDGDIWIRYS